MELETRYRALEMALKASGPTSLGAAEDIWLVQRARAFAQYLEGNSDDASDATPDSKRAEGAACALDELTNEAQALGFGY